MERSNLTELIWDERIDALLRLCGESERYFGEQASDFERLFALFCALEQLKGHPLPLRLAAFLKTEFSISCPLKRENLEIIWKKSAEALWADPDLQKLPKPDLFAVQEGDDAVFLKDLFLGGAMLARTRLVGGNRFEKTRATESAVWKEEIKKRCLAAANTGFLGELLVLPESYRFHSPHPYRIDAILQKKKRTPQDQTLLLSQLARYLAEECISYNQAFLVRIEGDPAEAIKLFSYLEKTVGLPFLLWNLPPEGEMDLLLEFSAQHHKRPVICALNKKDFPEPQARRAYLRKLATRYPFGRIRVY